MARTLDDVRATLYEVLGRLYGRELTPALAQELHTLGCTATLAEACPELAAPDTPGAFEDVAVEFTRLFCGPGPHVSPCASVHRLDDERPGQLWGSTTGEVKRFMAHYGLEPTAPGAIPDHLAVLLEFMGRVIRAKLDADPDAIGEAGPVADDIQREFFRRYLDPWVHTFLQRVDEAGPAPFYRALAAVTDEFLAQERALLTAAD